MSPIGELVKAIVATIVAGDWPALKRLTSGSRLSIQDIQSSLARYGRTLVLPPSESFQDLDAVEVLGTRPRTVNIRFPLWTVEEGRSDLELNLTATEVGRALWSATIEDLLVP